MTKIKIIGDPGEQNVELMEDWLKKYLQKFNLSPEEIYLIFIKNAQQMEEVYRKYIKIEISAPPSVTELAVKEVTEEKFQEMQTTAYLHKTFRKEGTPPIILIKRGSKVSEEDFLDEVAHIKEDEEGWNKIKIEALKLLFQDYQGIWDSSTYLSFFDFLTKKIVDFFSSEITSRYGLNSEAFKEREKKLSDWVKLYLVEWKKKKISTLGIAMTLAFWTTLPPSYPKKEDEEKLERIFIEDIKEIKPLYREIKSIVSKLKSPPKIANIYQCGAEIIELAQEYSSK